jgi:hypothetical protein
METLHQHARVWVTSALACAATAGVLAQTPTSKPAPPKPMANAERFVVIGCISREAPGRGAAAAARFLLTDRRSDPPTVYQLQGDASQLDLHTGHTVEIAGPLTPSQGGGAARGGAAARRTLKVTSLTWISTTCGKT